MSHKSIKNSLQSENSTISTNSLHGLGKIAGCSFTNEEVVGLSPIPVTS